MNREHSKIEFKNVNFEYNENVSILKNINLDIKKGETVAFVGNSGGGKTTIVNLLPRFYDIKSGSIIINGIDIMDFTFFKTKYCSRILRQLFIFRNYKKEYFIGKSKCDMRQTNNYKKLLKWLILMNLLPL